MQEKRKDSEKLYGFINTEIHPNVRKKVIALVEKYVDACSRYHSSENEIYYEKGFSSAMQIVLTSFKKVKGDLLMEDFISLLFKTKKENDMLVINDDELTNWENKLKRVMDELDSLVTNHLDEKYKARYSQLLLEMDETNSGIKDCMQELYFKAGVKEGAEIYETLKNKEN